MEIKRSPLIYEDFVILDSHIQTIVKDNSVKCDLDNIPLEIDFETLVSKDNDEKYNLALNINGNDIKNPVMGYKFSIIANGFFELKKINEDNEDKANQFLLYSALPMLISSVRNYLINITSYAPYGKYILPAIDLPDLIKQKFENMNSSDNDVKI